MITAIKNKLAVYYAINSMKKKSNSEMDYDNFFTRSKTILLVLPTSQVEADSSISFYRSLISLNKTIKLLRLSPVKISELNTTDIINLKEGDMNKINLPNKNFLNKIKSDEYDVVVDLNCENNLIAGYISSNTNSKFKVGFKKENADLYYNFQVSKSAINSEISYKNLLNSLLMF